MAGRGRTIEVLLITAGLAATACTTPRARIKDAPRPTAPVITIDLGPVFEPHNASNSLAASAERPNLRRVMLSPNLVFESSRASLKEPEVSGPRGPEGAPNLGDAVGKPVEIAYSSMLMTELVKRRAGLIAPAMSRYFIEDCDKACNLGTWVERVLSHYQRVVASSKAAEEPPNAPTLLMAVRELGLAWREFEVVAAKAANGDLLFQLRRWPGEPSACPGIKVELPVARFSGEVLGLREGRILARIDELVTPSFQQDFRRRIYAATYTRVSGVGYDQENSDHRGVGPTYTYVERWDPQDVSCALALEEFKRMRDQALREVDQTATMRSVILLGLSVVTGEDYSLPVTHRPPRAPPATTPSSSPSAVTPESPPSGAERAVVIQPPSVPQPPQAPPARCVASELPEWRGASALEKKALLERCRPGSAAGN